MSVPRLSPCPCGSGRAYRRCCRAKDRAAEDARRAFEDRAIRAAAERRALLTAPCPDCEDRRDLHRTATSRARAQRVARVGEGHPSRLVSLLMQAAMLGHVR